MSIKEQIRAEIERLYGKYKEKYDDTKLPYCEGLIDGLDLVEQFLDTLPEQPVEGLEEEIEMEWDSFNKHLAEYDDGTDEVVWLNLVTFTEIARHFAEWGAEHLKR